MGCLGSASLEASLRWDWGTTLKGREEGSRTRSEKQTGAWPLTPRRGVEGWGGRNSTTEPVSFEARRCSIAPHISHAAGKCPPSRAGAPPPGESHSCYSGEDNFQRAEWL